MPKYPIKVVVNRFNYLMVEDEMYELTGKVEVDEYELENVVTGESDMMHIDEIARFIEQSDLVLLKK
jgi:hypothetical protein